MKNSSRPSPVGNANDNDNSNSASSKFIRKSNSQAFNSYQNMLKYKVNTEGADKTNDPPQKQPLERKNTPSNSKPRSLQKSGTKVEEPTKRLPAIIPSQQPVQDMAMHMCTNIFMNSTTRFLKGYNDISQNDVSKSKQKKRKTFSGKPMDQSINQNRQQTLTPKKSVTPGKNNIQTVNSPTQSITSILDYKAPRYGEEKRQQQAQKQIVQPGSPPGKQPIGKKDNQSNDNIGINANRMKNQQQPSGTSLQSESSRNPQNTAHKMAGERYMNATTRYMKGSGVQGQQNRKSPSPKNEQKKERSASQPRPISQPKVEEKPQVRPNIRPQATRQQVQPQKQQTAISPPSRPEAQSRQNVTSNENRRSPQRNAMNMAAQSYMNSTTKYVKVDGQASKGSGRYSPTGKDSPTKEKSISQNRPQERVRPSSPPKKPETQGKIQRQSTGPGRQSINQIGIESKKQLPAMTPVRNRFQTQVVKQPPTPVAPHPTPASNISKSKNERITEKIAYNMTGQTYFNSTTKYVKTDGQASRGKGGRQSPEKQSPQKQSPQKQSSPPKRQLIRQQQTVPARPTPTPQPAPASIVTNNTQRPSRSTEKNAMNMTGQSYMNSTTKYMKVDDQASKNKSSYSPPSKEPSKQEVKRSQHPTATPPQTPASPVKQKRPERSTEKNAYNMTGQSYMNSTTKYVKVDGPPSRGPGTYSPQKQKQRSVSQPKNESKPQPRQRVSHPKKVEESQPQYPARPGTSRQEQSQAQVRPGISRKQETPVEQSKNRANRAYQMTAQNYLNSTTKFVKDAGSPTKNDSSRYSPPRTERSVGNKSQERNRSQPKQEPLKPAPSQTFEPQQPQPRYGSRKAPQISSNQNAQSRSRNQVSVNSNQNNRSSPSPQSRPNSLPRNQVKTEPISKNNIANEKSIDKNEASTPKTPFARQPVNKNGRNLAFVKPDKDQSTSVKEQSQNESQPFVTQSKYGQKGVKPAGSAQSIKTEPNQPIGKINRAGSNAATSQTNISPRQNNINQNTQVRPGQQNANIRPNQSKVEEVPSNMRPNQTESRVNPRQQQNQQKSLVIQNSKVVVEPTKAEPKQTARVMKKQQNSKIDLVDEICGSKSPANRNQYRKPTVTQNTNKSTRITNLSGKTSLIQQNNNTSSTSVNNTQNYQNRPVVQRSPKAVIPQNATQPSSARNITNVQLQKQIQQVKSETKIGINAKGISTKTISSVNDNQNKIKTEQTTKIEINLVKSPVLAFVLAKWLMNFKQIGFSSIKANKEHKIRYSQEAVILAHSTNTFSFNVQINNYKTAFDHLKKNFVSGLKSKKDTIVRSEETKERIAILLQKFFLGKIRHSFNLLKIQSWIQSQSVSTSEKKKKQIAKDQKKDKKEHLRPELSSLFNIVKALRSEKMKSAFDRINLRAVDAQSKNKALSQSVGLVKKQSGRTAQKPAGRDHETEKKSLLGVNSNIASDISGIQYRISDSKRMVEREKNKLIKKMDELKLKNKKSSNDVEGKKKKNQLLKDRYQEETKNVELDLPDDESLVTTLTQIYADVFRSTDEVIDCQSLKKRHKLQIEDFNNITTQWNSLAKNIELKLEISLWQGSDKKEGKVRKAMKDERKAEADLMKNYIRERYVWEWVHTASSKI